MRNIGPLSLDTDWDPQGVSVRLTECVKNHSCAHDYPKSLPTRLLDLKSPDPDRIKLILTSDLAARRKATFRLQKVRYAALSYCWGTGAAFVTDSSNLASHMERISVPELPQTLRDAVAVTKSLGIRYLWIDALCILQGRRDDPGAHEDWERESALMASIYGNALVTIIAAGAPSSHHGLRHGWHGQTLRGEQPAGSDRVSSNSSSFEAAVGPDARDPMHIYVRNRVNLSSLSLSDGRTPGRGRGRGVNMGREAISGRAWALQEWLLAKRLLVFATTGVYFICDRFPLQTTNLVYRLRFKPKPSPTWRLKRGIPWLQRGATTTPTPAGNSNTVLQAAQKSPSRWVQSSQVDVFETDRTIYTIQMSDWQKVLINFCARDLSDPGDKLVAISGIAEEYSRLMRWPSTDYFAGLWRQTLTTDLLWRHETPLGVPQAYDHSDRRLERAPSWSWASVDGNILFLEIHMGGPEAHVESVEVKGCQVCSKSDNLPFGQVQSGRLFLECRYQLGRTQLTAFPEDYDGRMFHLAHHTSGSPMGSCLFDTLGDISAPTNEGPIYCLSLIGTGTIQLGVVVILDEERGAFRRVGLWQYPEWRDEPYHLYSGNAGSPLSLCESREFELV